MSNTIGSSGPGQAMDNGAVETPATRRTMVGHQRSGGGHRHGKHARTGHIGRVKTERAGMCGFPQEHQAGAGSPRPGDRLVGCDAHAERTGTASSLDHGQALAG
ncbi:hypothetical protein AWV80_06380 [Cupriavidus sp. UYMU48A]|nr:hypothetical protein AWV80_06380 [Cupriavidus sp. UYMU48A]